MANRIEPLSKEDVSDPEIKTLMEQAEEMTGDSIFAGVLARRPHILKQFFELYGSAVWQDAAVEPELMELMRYRCADVNECVY